MKALILAHAAVKSSNRRVYRSLAERGVDVTLVIPEAWSSGLGPIKAECEPEDSPLQVVQLRRFGFSHSNMYWLQGLGRVAKQAKPDVVYVDEDPAGFAAAQGARVKQESGAGLIILAIQNLVKRYPPPFNAAQRYVFNRADIAVSVSDQAAAALRARGYDGPVRPMPFCTGLVPPAPEVRERARRALGFTQPTIGYAGRLVEEKGVDTLLHAAAALPGVRVAIAGDGFERDALERLSASLGLEERVRFLGVQPPQAMEEFIGALDVLALPSRTRANWSEQFGRVLIEAMASGVPVAASASGAIPEVVGDAGFLVPEDDPAALATALQRALNPARAQEVRGRGLARVAKHFSLAVETNALQDAFEFAARQGECR